MSITVGIPFSGESEHLEAAIRSVFAQTFSDWRLILISDNASKMAVERASLIQDPRVTLKVHSENLGLAARLNEIAEIATTPLLARMDADDVMEPTRLEKQMEHLNRSGANVAASRAFVIDANGQVLGRYKEPDLPGNRSGFLTSNALTHPTVMASTSWFREYPYDTDFERCQDKELWLRSSDKTNFEKSSEELLFYRIDRGISVQKQALSSRYNRKAILKYGPRIEGWPRTAVRLGNSHAKQSCFALAVLAGQSRRIYRSKFEELASTTKAHAEASFLTATSATVAGWD